ncbi:MAG: NAD-dependent epimerase/dehydratase family protein [Nocardioides sp.]|uniref:NAD-dependent epimerase/dehydratase family protein n=1 Tax=Nocardioides sp. TaxID=35761 RepID=UPI0039E33790
MSKVIITGGAGLVGQNLLVEIADDPAYEITVIDKRAEALKVMRELFPSVTAVEADLAEDGAWTELFAGAEVVVQLHAQIGAPTREPFERNNVLATEKVLAAITAHQVPYLIHVSSSVVRSVADDWYTQTKREQEELVLASGIPSLVLRPTLMYGWFDRKHLGWLSRFMKRIPVFPIPGNGRFMRQPLYVRDFARVIASALRIRPVGEIHDVTGVDKVDYVDLIRAIRTAVHARTLLVFIPVKVFAFLLWVWARFDKNPPFTDQQLNALVAGDEFDDTDWHERFGVTPTPLAAAVEETFNDPRYSEIVLEF